MANRLKSRDIKWIAQQLVEHYEKRGKVDVWGAINFYSSLPKDHKDYGLGLEVVSILEKTPWGQEFRKFK